MVDMVSRNYTHVQRLAIGCLLASLALVSATSPEPVLLVTTGAGQDFFTLTDHTPAQTAPILFLPSPGIAKLGPLPTAGAKALIKGLDAASSTETSVSTSIMTLTPTVTVTVTTPTSSASQTSSTTTSGAMESRAVTHL
jgi:hypothetical protein